ncbi:MAG: HesA/MoeB/ThiF family protein [Elusimicrobia bacterium]|nr:HesA/MoeB/ThiF family protein [Elusimicrobiota bacterium]
MRMMALSKSEIIRYSRHMIIPEIGIKGQEKIKASSACVIGAGGLGSACLSSLAGAGIGKLGVVEHGKLELSNLHRQAIYALQRPGTLKAEAAVKFLKKLNWEIKIKIHQKKFDGKNAVEIIKDYDIIADCTDNFEARFAINRACYGFKKPLVFGAVYRFEAQVSLFDSSDGPCLRCLYPAGAEPQNFTCAEEGIAGPVAAAAGHIQALEVIKFITGVKGLKNKLLMLDFANVCFNIVDVKKRPDCPVCSGRSSRHSAGRTMPPCSGKPVSPVPYITPEDLKKKFGRKEKFALLDLRHEWEHDLCGIKGDLDPALEAILYCRNESRSVTAYKILENMGFKKIFVLKGGIDAWAEKIEKGMIRY